MRRLRFDRDYLKKILFISSVALFALIIVVVTTVLMFTAI